MRGKRNRVEQWQPETGIWQHGIGRQIIRIEDISAVHPKREQILLLLRIGGLEYCIAVVFIFVSIPKIFNWFKDGAVMDENVLFMLALVANRRRRTRAQAPRSVLVRELLRKRHSALGIGD